MNSPAALVAATGAGPSGSGRTAVATNAANAAGVARPAGNPAPLRPGMFARVTTVFAVRESAVVVPEEAIVPQGGRQFVIKVVDRASVPAMVNVAGTSGVQLVSLRQEVKLGARQQGKVEITDGLVAGETVVVAGQQRLQRDGTPLRVVDLNRPGASGTGAPAGKGAASAPAATTAAANP